MNNFDYQFFFLVIVIGCVLFFYLGFSYGQCVLYDFKNERRVEKIQSYDLYLVIDIGEVLGKIFQKLQWNRKLKRMLEIWGDVL